MSSPARAATFFTREASGSGNADEEGDRAALANARHADQEIDPIGEMAIGEASEISFRGASAASLGQGESAKICSHLYTERFSPGLAREPVVR
jgi:hypothetical protein